MDGFCWMRRERWAFVKVPGYKLVGEDERQRVSERRESEKGDAEGDGKRVREIERHRREEGAPASGAGPEIIKAKVKV